MECPVEGKEVMEDGEKEMRAKEGEGGRIRRRNKEKKKKPASSMAAV